MSYPAGIGHRDERREPLRLVVVGAGGHGRECADVALAIDPEGTVFDLVGFLDDRSDDAALESTVVARGASLLGGTERLASTGAAFVIGIASPTARSRVDRIGRDAQLHSPVLVHPSATLGTLVRFGDGTVVAAGARLTTHIEVGRHGYVGPNATIGHDVTLGDFVTVLPGATVSGNVTLGDAVTIGTGANILEGRHIGAGASVGAGAVVVRDVAEGVTVVGVPARPMRS